MYSNNKLGLYQRLHTEQQSQDQTDIPDQDMLDVMQHPADEQSDTQGQPKAQFVQDIQVMQALKALQDTEAKQLQPARMHHNMSGQPVQSQAKRHERALPDAPMQDAIAQTQFQKQNSQPESQSQAQTENQILDAMQLHIKALITAQSRLQLQQRLIQQQSRQVHSQVQNQQAHHEQQTNEIERLQQKIQQIGVQLDAIKSQLTTRQQRLQPQKISQNPYPQMMEQSQPEEHSCRKLQNDGLNGQVQHVQPTAEHVPSLLPVSGFSDVSSIRTTGSSTPLPHHLVQLPDTEDQLDEFHMPRSPLFEISYLNDSENSILPAEIATSDTDGAITGTMDGTNRDSNWQDAPFNTLGESNQHQNQTTENSFDSDLPLSVIQRRLITLTAAPSYGSASDVEMDEAMRMGSLAQRVKCTKCDFIFANSEAMDRHISRSHPEPPKEEHICLECRQMCRSKSSLYRHRRTVHGGELKFVCAICRAGFCTKKSLSVHRNQQHPDFYKPKARERPTKFWDCQLCEYGSNNHCHVIRHFFTKHSGDALMECLKGCGLTFESGANAKLHFSACNHMVSIDE